VLNQERVERDPVVGVDGPGEGLFGLFWGPGANDAQAVRDPVYVGVDRDCGDPIAKDEDAVRGLRTDAAQARQLLERPRHHTPEPTEDLARHFADHARLRVVEPRTTDEGLDGGGGRRGEGGGVGVFGEQQRARGVGRLVACTLGKDRPDEDLERVFRVVAEVRSSPISRSVEGRESVEERLPVERRGAHGRLARAWGRAGEGRGSGGRVTPGSERSGSSVAPDGRINSPMR
jgi:hypothetical protein